MPIELLSAAKETGKAVREAIEKTGEAGLKIGEKHKEASENDISELYNKSIEGIKNVGDGVRLKLNEIKNLTPEQLREKMEQNLEQVQDNLEGSDEGIRDSDEVVKDELTDEEKAKIKEETDWTDEIIDAISSLKEYEIYKNAGLVEVEIGGKRCLIRNDIDWNQKDAMERTSKERAEQGLSPINKDGKVIELHHIGQHADSPLAELTQEEHRGKGNDTILHDKTKETEIDRHAFASERSEHWEARTQGSEAIE